MKKLLLQTRIIFFIFIAICAIIPNAIAGSVIYTYDNAGRLTKADYENGNTSTYTYDKAGNLLETKVLRTAPDISASPGNKDFGEIITGNSSTPQTFTISNIGTDNLVIGTLSLTGTAASEFSIQNDTCSGKTLAQSENCTVKALFSPATDGAKSANLSIPSNDPDTPTLNALLSGTGKSGPGGTTPCPESVSPVSKTFGSDGGTDSVAVVASGSCDWTAASSDTSWLKITSGGSGTGDGTVNYTVSPNTGASSRTATITITGDTSKIFKVNQAGVGASPVPDIKASSSDGPITSGTSDTLSVSVSLAAGGSSGMDCDWWAVADTPFGWYYFDVGIMNWVYAGGSFTDLSPTYQGPLFDLGTFVVLNMAGLPAGTYTFYFAVDNNMNGVLDFGELYYDSVVVNITP